MIEPTDQPAPFEETEVTVASEAAAAAEARRRQLLETDPDTIEWIYLRNADGQWVARRVLRYGSPPAPVGPKSMLGKIGAFLIDLVRRPARCPQGH